MGQVYADQIVLQKPILIYQKRKWQSINFVVMKSMHVTDDLCCKKYQLNHERFFRSANKLKLTMMSQFSKNR